MPILNQLGPLVPPSAAQAPGAGTPMLNQIGPGAGTPDYASQYLSMPQVPWTPPVDPGPQIPDIPQPSVPSSGPSLAQKYGLAGQPTPGASAPPAQANAHSAAPPAIRTIDETASADDAAAKRALAAEQKTAAASAQTVAPRLVGATHDASRNPWTKEHQGQYADAQQREGDALSAIADIDAGDQLRKAAQTEELAKQLQTHDDAQKLVQARQQQQIQDREQKIATLANDVQSTKINPMQAFQEMGAGAKFLSIIGAAVSGFANPGGRNQMLDSLDAMAQKNIDAQKANLANKRESVAEQKGLLADMTRHFGDVNQGEIGARMAIREQAAMKAEQMALASGSQRAVVGAQAFRAETDKRNALDARQLLDVPSFVPAHITGGAGGEPLKPADKAKIVQLEDGRSISAPTAEEATKLRSHQAAIVDLERDAKRLDALRSEPESYVPYTPKHAELQKLSGQMLLNVRKVEEVKSPGKGTADLADQIIGDPTSMTSRSGQRALSYARDERKNYDASVRSLGAEQVKRGYTRDAKGELVPTAENVGQTVNPASKMPDSFREAQ